MYCENCGHKVPYNACFCPNCGYDLKHGNGFSSSIFNIKNKWKGLSSGKKAISALLICIFGLMLLNGFMISSFINDVDESVNDYDSSYSGISSGDSDDAYTSIIEDNPAPSESSSSSDSSSSNSHTQDTSSNYESSGSGGSYVGSVNSDKFHYPSCGQASKIKSGNLVTFSSREDAISRGYSPCKFCSP